MGPLSHCASRPVKFRCCHEKEEAIVHQIVWNNTEMRNLQCLDRQGFTVSTKNGGKVLATSVLPKSFLQAASEVLESRSCCCSWHFSGITAHFNSSSYWRLHVWTLRVVWAKYQTSNALSPGWILDYLLNKLRNEFQRGIFPKTVHVHK